MKTGRSPSQSKLHESMSDGTYVVYKIKILTPHASVRCERNDDKTSLVPSRSEAQRSAPICDRSERDRSVLVADSTSRLSCEYVPGTGGSPVWEVSLSNYWPSRRVRILLLEGDRTRSGAMSVSGGRSTISGVCAIVEGKIRLSPVVCILPDNKY